MLISFILFFSIDVDRELQWVDPGMRMEMEGAVVDVSRFSGFPQERFKKGRIFNQYFHSYLAAFQTRHHPSYPHGKLSVHRSERHYQV